MATVTLRPDAVVVGNNWTDAVVGGTLPTLLADNSDSSWTQNTATNGTGLLALGLSTFAFPAGAQIRSVTPRIRFQASGNGYTWGFFQPGFGIIQGGVQAGSSPATNTATVTVSGATFATRPSDGGAWTQADIDNLQFLVNLPDWHSGAIVYVFEAYLDVVYNEKPVAKVFGPYGAGFTDATLTNASTTVTSAAAAFTAADVGRPIANRFIPAGTTIASVTNATTIVLSQAATASATLETIYLGRPVTTTSAPAVLWWYTDPESDLQERYRVKVFSAAQYGAGGFNPETATPVWDSGEVLSVVTSVTPGPLPNNTTYRAYVKVADVGSGGRYGDWASFGFSIAVAAPPAPTLTATADDPLARVALVATHGSFASAQTFVIEKSVDGGATWAILRAADGVPPTAGSTVTVYDYELPRGVEADYRAYTVGVVGGFPIVSPNSTEATATVDATGWWLKDPLAPANNSQLRVQPGFAPRRKEPQAIYEPLGGTVSVVVSDGVRGVEGTMQLWATNAARYARLEALVTSGHVLLLEDVLGRSWYIKCGAATEWSLMRAQPTPDESTPIRHCHQITIPFAEVGIPTGAPVAGEPTLDPPDAPVGSYGYLGGY